MGRQDPAVSAGPERSNARRWLWSGLAPVWSPAELPEGPGSHSHCSSLTFSGLPILVPPSPPLTVSVFNWFLSVEPHSVLGAWRADRRCSRRKISCPASIPSPRMGSVPQHSQSLLQPRLSILAVGVQQSRHRPGSQPPAVYLPKIFLQLEFNLENVLQIEYLGRIF